MEPELSNAVALRGPKGWINKVAFDKSTDLEKISDSQEMQRIIDVDIEGTFQGLVNAGGLLQVAYAKAGNEPCSADILKCISKYQTTVGDNKAATHEFVSNALQSLITHKEALRILDTATKAKEYSIALEHLQKCIEIAQAMEIKAQEMVDKTDELTKTADDALNSAKNDSIKNDQLSQQLKQEIADLQAKRDSFEATKKELEGQLEQAEEEERVAAKAADEARQRQFQLGIVSAVMGGLSSVGQAAMAVVGSHPAAVASRAVNNANNNSSGAAAPPAEAGAAAPAGATPANDASANPLPVQPADSGVHFRMSRKEEELNKAEEEYQEALDAPRGETEEEEKERKENIELKKQRRDEKKSATEKLSAEIKDLSKAQERHAESLEAKESAARKLKWELNKQKRELAGQIQEALTTLTNKSDKKSEVEQTIALLEMVVNNMGIVKTSFDQARLYWKAIVTHCTRLVNMKGTFEIMTKMTTNQIDDLNELGGNAEGDAEKLMKVLTELRLPKENVKQLAEDGCILEDLDEMEEEDLMEYIPKKLHRKRVLKYIADRKTPEGRAKIQKKEEEQKELFKKLIEQRAKEIEEAKEKLKQSKEQLRDSVLMSAWYWAAIGRVSHDAYVYIVKAKKKVDSVMNNLGGDPDAQLELQTRQIQENLEKVKDQADSAMESTGGENIAAEAEADKVEGSN